MIYKTEAGGRIKILKIDYHRNGVGGNGFNVVLFEYERSQTMVALVFPGRGNVGVLDVGLLSAGTIDHTNRWRGDDFEPALRRAIDDSWNEEHPDNLMEDDDE